MPLHRGRPDLIRMERHPTIKHITSPPKPADPVESFRDRARQFAQTNQFEPIIRELDQSIPNRVRPNAPMPHIETLLRKDPALTREIIREASMRGLNSDETINLLADELRKRLARHRGYLE